MSRSQRLFDLIQLLRQHRYPVAGQKLADELDVSLRTIYRDIATLQAQGATIEGEAGLGFLLRPGFMLPPLMFSEEEIEAMVLGARWVAEKADSNLQQAARNALSKIGAVLPEDLRDHLFDSGLLIGPGLPIKADNNRLIEIRQSIRKEQKIMIEYLDVNDNHSERLIWPFALGFFEQTRVVIAWCELRQAIRYFRVDRINSLGQTDIRYPKRRRVFLKQWREQENIPHQ